MIIRIFQVFLFSLTLLPCTTRGTKSMKTHLYFDRSGLRGISLKKINFNWLIHRISWFIKLIFIAHKKWQLSYKFSTGRTRQHSVETGATLTRNWNVMRSDPNRHYDGKRSLSHSVKHEDDRKNRQHINVMTCICEKSFCVSCPPPLLFKFLISYIPFLHLLRNNKQSLFLLLTFSHSFSHHLSFLPFILHGQSLSLSCSLVSFSHLFLHLIAALVPPSFLLNLPHIFISFHHSSFLSPPLWVTR